jgi:hypothetical protein
MQIDTDQPAAAIETTATPVDNIVSTRAEIIAEVVKAVLSASAPQPLEALAERAIRVLGHGKTVGTEWGGAGNFRDLLAQDLPSSVNLTEQAPFFAYDVSRAIARNEPQRISAPATTSTQTAPESTPLQPVAAAPPAAPEATAPPAPSQATEELAPERAVSLQESIALIHQACKAPPLSPPEYRAVFTLLANELGTNQMQGNQTIDNVRTLALELGIDVKRDDIRFIIDVVGKQDPWFEQGASALVFASRFRNFVIGRCQEAGMQLSADEIDLIDAWFAGNVPPENENRAAPSAPATAVPEQATAPAAGDDHVPLGERTARWWQETTSPRDEELAPAAVGDEEFPRIVRNRLKA